MLAVLLAQSDVSDVAAVGSSAAGAGLAIGMLIFYLLFFGVGFIIWIWALIDVIRRQFSNPSDKTLWLIIVILLYWLGGLIYLIVGRKKGTISEKNESGPTTTGPTPPPAQ